MGWAVLIRGANVGGNVFRPSTMAAALPDLGLLSIGAAGTFAAQGGKTAGAVRAAIARQLPFDAEIIVLPASRLHRLLSSDPLGSVELPAGGRRFLTVTSRPIRPTPEVPIVAPDPIEWQVQVLGVDTPFLWGIYRRLGPRLLYPNALIEKRFGVPATTRWWETIESVGRALRLAAG